jgi:eukaryotic-like serine/threonine-protein kinase
MTQQTDRLNTALAGRYRIERHLGEGGMASVYLCEDLRHKRKVALKLLKPELAAVLGADRFVQEITTTASMQHPHILPLFDSGSADGFLFYVMPLVEGETLREKLNRETQLGVDEAVRIAREVLDALQYAHEHGIVHRDVKPENILLHGGHAMVADFGIALAVSAAAGGRMTETGLSLGTPHYMSPEQATAEKEITARSDVYSLGSVLYEMLTGEPPHMGNAAQQIIMKIITEPAKPVTALRKSVPPNVSAAVAKSLEKLPADRFESAKAFSDALANPSFASATLAGPGAAAASGSDTQQRTLRTALPLTIALLAGIGIGSAAWSAFGPQPHRAFGADAVARFSVPLASSIGFGMANSPLDIAPDASAIVVGSLPQRLIGLFVRAMDDPRLVPIPGTEGAFSATFSPDGASIAFVKAGTLMKIARAGGPATTIATGVGTSGLAWGEGDQIVYGKPVAKDLRSGGLWIVPATGGEPHQLTTIDSATDRLHGTPAFLPGGRTVIFSIVSNDGIGTIAAVTLNGKLTRLSQRGFQPKYTDDGHLFFYDLAGTVLSAPFDARGLRFTGPAIPVLQGVTARTNRTGLWSVSRNGTLVHFSGSFATTLMQVDRAGVAAPLFPDTRGFRRPRVSPDGRRVVVEIGGGGAAGSGAPVDLWMLDRASGLMNRFTFGRPVSDPTWTRDGKRVAFARLDSAEGRPDVFWQAADGSGAPEPMYEAPGSQWPYSFTPDGKSLVMDEQGGFAAQTHLSVLDIGTKKATPLFASEFTNRLSDISADGKWITYTSNESGRIEVYVRPFPGPGGKWPVSSGGGDEPLWNPNGREIFYRDGVNVIAVSVSTAPTFSVLSRKALFEDRYDHSGTLDWHVFPDGNHFAMLRPVQGEAALTVTINALAAVKRAAKK